MSYGRKYSWNKNKKCLDCGRPIANLSIRCIGCRNRAIKRKPKILAVAKCLVCNNSFTYYKSAEKGMFCSPKCKNIFQAINNVGINSPNWRGGYFPYFGSNWYQIRREIRAERVLICERCGISESKLKKQLHLHHKIPRRLFAKVEDSNTKENLILLCEKCHKSVENKQLWSDNIFRKYRNI